MKQPEKRYYMLSSCPDFEQAMIEISGDAYPFFSHISHRMGGGLFPIITQYLFRRPKRLAKKGQNRYSSSVTRKHSSSCLDRKFKQSGKKYVETIKASKANKASETTRVYETLTTKAIDTISNTQTVGSPCSVCPTADAHG
jgi:hypothetical protein